MKNIKLGFVLTLLLFGYAQFSVAEPEGKSSILHPKGLLWKIEKPASSASYLFGTMHVSDPQVIHLSVPVETAFKQAEHFVMEVLMNFEATSYVASMSFFNDGRTLKNVMAKADYQRLTELINKRIFIAEDVVNKMKPWVVLMLLMLPVDQQNTDAVALDMVLYRRASQRKMQLTGLESVQEQMSLFDSMSLPDQLWLLNRAIDEIKITDAQFPEMLKAYVNRDLAGLVEIQNAFMSEDSEIDNRFMYKLLDERNVLMASRMLPILKQGKAFIAIGALHLPGRGGVLDLLEQAGYQVTSVY